jgi:hypothetical protein
MAAVVVKAVYIMAVGVLPGLMVAVVLVVILP